MLSKARAAAALLRPSHDRARIRTLLAAQIPVHPWRRCVPHAHTHTHTHAHAHTHPHAAPAAPGGPSSRHMRPGPSTPSPASSTQRICGACHTHTTTTQTTCHEPRLAYWEGYAPTSGGWPPLGAYAPRAAVCACSPARRCALPGCANLCYSVSRSSIQSAGALFSPQELYSVRRSSIQSAAT